MEGDSMSQIRNYILRDLKENPALKQTYDTCINNILNDTANLKTDRRASLKELDVNGQIIKQEYAFEYYLMELETTGFTYEKAHHFSEKMRALFGFKSQGWGRPLLNILRDWYEHNIKHQYVRPKDPSRTWKNEWVVKEGEPSTPIPEDYFQFACYIAISHLKYGASYDSVTANEIFTIINLLGSTLPAKLKKHGSGDLPKTITEYKDPTLTCKANDAFATIRITIKEETQPAYENALNFLINLLKTDFPRSYSLDFRSPAKNYLPIKKLPKKGINQLFTNAASYTALHEKIEQYAQLAMREFEWYNNLENENCAMPGTFAVFSLGILSEAHHPLVTKYLKICDGEHQSLQGEFVLAYIEKFGFTQKGLELYKLCEENIQHLPKKLATLYAKKE